MAANWLTGKHGGFGILDKERQNQMDDETFKHLPTVAKMNSSVGKTQKPDFGPSAPEQVATMVARMLDCFRPSKGVDPQVFATAIVGILLQYPMDVVDEITSPVIGLPSRQEFMPSPFEVKQAAEKIMQPRRESQARAARIKAQLDERDAIEDQRRQPRKQSMRELEDEMHERGLDMPGWRARQARKIDATLRAEMSAKYGAAYDSIPDLPEEHDVPPVEEKLITWKERETVYGHLPPWNPPRNY
jgi:hypothetical protein